jgi:hypothetical protein
MVEKNSNVAAGRVWALFLFTHTGYGLQQLGERGSVGGQRLQSGGCVLFRRFHFHFLVTHHILALLHFGRRPGLHQWAGVSS